MDFLVSVPSFGDSFFIHQREVIRSTVSGVSVPSFGDSFFMSEKELADYSAGLRIVSVPSFGDSFFILSL